MLTVYLQVGENQSLCCKQKLSSVHDRAGCCTPFWSKEWMFETSALEKRKFAKPSTCVGCFRRQGQRLAKCRELVDKNCGVATAGYGRACPLSIWRTKQVLEQGRPTSKTSTSTIASDSKQALNLAGQGAWKVVFASLLSRPDSQWRISQSVAIASVESRICLYSFCSTHPWCRKCFDEICQFRLCFFMWEENRHVKTLFCILQPSHFLLTNARVIKQIHGLESSWKLPSDLGRI